jgi:hypothetical protein
VLLLQAVGQLTYIRPYVTDFSPEWLFSSSLALVAGALSLIYVAGAQQQHQQQQQWQPRQWQLGMQEREEGAAGGQGSSSSPQQQQQRLQQLVWCMLADGCPHGSSLAAAY